MVDCYPNILFLLFFNIHIKFHTNVHTNLFARSFLIVYHSSSVTNKRIETWSLWGRLPCLSLLLNHFNMPQHKNNRRKCLKVKVIIKKNYVPLIMLSKSWAILYDDPKNSIRSVLLFAGSSIVEWDLVICPRLNMQSGVAEIWIRVSGNQH